MAWFDDDSVEAQAYDEVTKRPNKAEWSDELMTAAAAYEAAERYEDYIAQNGHPDKQAQGKKVLAAAIDSFVDREVETNGLDFIDRERVKGHAQQRAEEELDNQYGDQW